MRVSFGGHMSLEEAQNDLGAQETTFSVFFSCVAYMMYQLTVNKTQTQRIIILKVLPL